MTPWVLDGRRSINELIIIIITFNLPLPPNTFNHLHLSVCIFTLSGYRGGLQVGWRQKAGENIRQDSLYGSSPGR